MNQAYLLTGGNVGNSKAILWAAQKAIAQRCGPVVRASALYRTAAWGLTHQPDFLNQVMLVHTHLDAHQLLQTTQAIEHEMGRRRQEQYGPRVLDIDLLLFNDCLIDTPGLKVPHPQMAFRRFVLVPLAEIAPDLLHPVKKMTIAEMLAHCPDGLAVHKL